MADEDLRKKLTPEQYNVTQEAGTEEVFNCFFGKKLNKIKNSCFTLYLAFHREI